MSAPAKLPMYRKLWRILNRRERRRAVWQLLLTAIAMVLETLGVGLVIPAVILMTQNDLGARYPAVQPLLDALGNPSQRALIVGSMLVLASVYVVKAAFLGFVAWRQNRFAFGIRVRLSEQLFTTYLRQPYAFHLKHNSAMLMRNAQYETQQLVQGAIRPLMILVTETLLMLGIGALLLFVEPVGALIVMAVLGSAAFAFHHSTRKRLVRWGEARRYHDGLRIMHMQQGLGSAKDIKLMGREEEFLAQYHVHNKRAADTAQKQATLAQLPRLGLELLAVSGLAMLVLAMMFQGRDMASILPVLGLFGAAAFRLLPSVNKVLTALQTMRFVSTVVDSVYTELQLPAPEFAKRSPGRRSELGRDIRADSASFTYEDAARPALSDVSFTVAKGETVGFIGASGSGKSTLIDLILGMLEPSAGRILVDGEDIRENLRRWQDQIGYVPQSIYLTDDSIRRNVAFGVADRTIDDAAVARALRAAQLDEFVAELPEGIETIVGERGVRLSGGQRQRIGIARALYHDPPVLVLDEATSALDTATERGVMKAVDALHGAKTILIVAHRLTTVESCDRIVRLQEGRVAEVGPPGDLLVVQQDLDSAAAAKASRG